VIPIHQYIDSLNNRGSVERTDNSEFVDWGVNAVQAHDTMTPEFREGVVVSNCDRVDDNVTGLPGSVDIDDTLFLDTRTAGKRMNTKYLWRAAKRAALQTVAPIEYASSNSRSSRNSSGSNSCKGSSRSCSSCSSCSRCSSSCSSSSSSSSSSSRSSSSSSSCSSSSSSSRSSSSRGGRGSSLIEDSAAVISPAEQMHQIYNPDVATMVNDISESLMDNELDIYADIVEAPSSRMELEENLATEDEKDPTQLQCIVHMGESLIDNELDIYTDIVEAPSFQMENKENIAKQTWQRKMRKIQRNSSTLFI